MNKQLKQLVINARDAFINGVTETNGEIYIHGSDKNLEKFAELIVKECADVAKTLHYPHFGQESEDYEERFDVSFKEHFGFNN